MFGIAAGSLESRYASTAITLIIRPATVADLVGAVELLRHAGLPVADVSAEELSLVAEKDGCLQGVIGLQSFEDVALLRSLAVSADERGAGIGPALVSALETMCLSKGVLELWLLTIDADAFFAKLGYLIAERSDAPQRIRSTEEFSALCPAEAVLMSKRLLH